MTTHLKVAGECSGAESDAPVALVDLDGTLCDCAGALARGLAELRGPLEDPREEEKADPAPHVDARRRLIMSMPGFWRNLRPLPLGFDILELLQELRFATYILTKGPSDHSLGWMEKFDWCRQHVPHLPIMMTEEKGLAHGAVLVEDWPPYIACWLRRCPGGTVIVPAQPWNTAIEESFPEALRYDGGNLRLVRERLMAARSSVG